MSQSEYTVTDGQLVRLNCGRPEAAVSCEAAFLNPVDAMVAWEHVQDSIRQDGRILNRPPNKWTLLIQSGGTVAAREHVLALVPALSEAWEIASGAGYDDAFDWDFAPRFLNDATDDWCRLRPEWQTIARTIAATGG